MFFLAELDAGSRDNVVKGTKPKATTTYGTAGPGLVHLNNSSRTQLSTSGCVCMYGWKPVKNQ